MKRYIRSARSESDYKNTDVLNIKIPKTNDATYEFIKSQLFAVAKGSESNWYVHADSNDEYTIYVNADNTSVDQVRNLIQMRFKNIAAVLTNIKFT